MFLQSASAFHGRKYWLSLKEEYIPDGKTSLIIFPSSDEILNHVAIGYLSEYMRRKVLKKVIIVTDQDRVAEDLRSSRNESIFIAKTDQEHITDLLNYYKLVQFIPRIIIISTEEPYGNDHIIGKAGIKIEDYVRNALYV